jgi:hypothetical protein
VQSDAGECGEQVVEARLDFRPVFRVNFQRGGHQVGFQVVVRIVEIVGRSEEEIVELLFVEAGKGGVEIGQVAEFFEERGEPIGFPVSADIAVVQGDVEGLLTLEREIDDNAFDFGDSLPAQHFQPLVSPDEVSRAFVPDKRLHEFEFGE